MDSDRFKNRSLESLASTPLIVGLALVGIGILAFSFYELSKDSFLQQLMNSLGTAVFLLAIFELLFKPRLQRSLHNAWLRSAEAMKLQREREIQEHFAKIEQDLQVMGDRADDIGRNIDKVLQEADLQSISLRLDTLRNEFSHLMTHLETKTLRLERLIADEKYREDHKEEIVGSHESREEEARKDIPRLLNIVLEKARQDPSSSPFSPEDLAEIEEMKKGEEELTRRSPGNESTPTGDSAGGQHGENTGLSQ
jgi:hypothetical protein